MTTIPKRELLKSFLRHPIRFTRGFVVGIITAYLYQKATGKKFKDMS